MGAITISYRHEPKTGKHELWVDYKSESDWIPAEHEMRHRDIVRSLFAEGTLDPEKVDRIYVRVEGQEVVVEELDEVFEPRAEAKAEKA